MKKVAFLLLLIITATAFTFAGCAPADPDDKLFENGVHYSKFGAVGDGKTDDFAAIKKAHEYANEQGVSVIADKGAKYYLGAHEDTIVVKTSVDWRDAKFIIDDKSAETDSNVWRYPLFTVQSDSAKQNVEVPDGLTLKVGQTETGLAFANSAMLALYNENKLDFIRRSSNDNQGYVRQEVILVDKDGKVDASTPIMWDYDEVTKIEAYSVTDTPILLRGGTFTTIANDDPLKTNAHYFERGIRVERSNTRVKNVKHYVTDEGETGAPYNGFFRTNFTANVVFENCVVTGHKYYNQGTYDVRPKSSVNVKLLNCTQSNDHTDTTYWGVMCSDYCKNLYMDGCTVSRFDAHMGVYNATITNSDIGQNISVTGGGTLLIENVTRRCAKGSWCNRFVTLREDYGSFFYGDVIIKDSKLISGRGINYVIAGNWYEHDFGYECKLPTTVTLDNVSYEITDDVTEYRHPYIFIFSHFTEREGETPTFAAASKNPPVLTKKVIIKNNVNNTVFKLTANTMGWFADTEVVYE